MLKPRATPWEIVKTVDQAPTGRDELPGVSCAPLGLGLCGEPLPRALPWAVTFAHLRCSVKGVIVNCGNVAFWHGSYFFSDP